MYLVLIYKQNPVLAFFAADNSLCSFVLRRNNAYYLLISTLMTKALTRIETIPSRNECTAVKNVFNMNNIVVV